MTIKIKCYSALLLTASISLIGCQTTEIVPPKTIPYNEKNTAIIEKFIDSDGDGIGDSRDACPGTPMNMVVDASGCPTPVYIIEEPEDSFRILYPENSSEPMDLNHDEMNRLVELMQEYDKIVVRIEGHVSKYEGRNRDVNKALASSRAEFIKNYMVLNHNIDPVRIITCDENYDRPIAANDSAEDRKMNQRAEVIMIGSFGKLAYNCK